MSVQRFLYTIDEISTWAGKAAAWLIIALMSVVCIEVFKRYILNTPPACIFDFDNMIYGTTFMLCGAYTLAQNAHVRGDFLYSSMRPRMQASLDIVLYIVFFLRSDLRHDFHALWGLHVGAERPRPRRLSLQLDAAAHAGLARYRAVHRVFSPI